MSNLFSPIRCFLLDLDGTFYLGEHLLEGALHFIETVRAQGKDFIFLSNNSSKQRQSYAQKISRLGLEISEEKIFTSGEATALYLSRQNPGARIFVVGTPSLAEEFQRHGFVLDEDHPDLLVLGFDTTLTYKKIWKACDFVRAGLPYIATHPDLNCPTETGFMPDIGAIMALIQVSTGRGPDLVVGKPNRLIVDELSRKINLPVAHLAMIGDRLYTDIALGPAAGITTALVLSGETHLEDLPGSPYQPDLIFRHLGEAAGYLSRA